MSGIVCYFETLYLIAFVVGWLPLDLMGSLILLFELFRRATYSCTSSKTKRLLLLFSLTPEASVPQRRALLWRKLQICGIRFDFSHEGEDVPRDLKRATLLELMDASESIG